MTKQFPEGKYMATVKIGPKGQIVIPKDVRDMFGISEGDALLLLANRGQGIAIQPFEYAENFFKEVYKLKEKEKDK